MLETPRSHMSTSGWFFSRLSSTIFFSDLDMAWAGREHRQAPAGCPPHTARPPPDPPCPAPAATHGAARLPPLLVPVLLPFPVPALLPSPAPPGRKGRGVRRRKKKKRKRRRV